MKKLIVILVLMAMLFSVAAVKPPRLVRLEVVNKSGEPVYVNLTGTGFDFKENKHVWAGGAYWFLPYQDPPQDAKGEFMDVIAYGMYTIPKDRYVITVNYEQEMKGDIRSDCLINWVPDGYEDGVAYFDMDRNRKLVIGRCNAIPKVLVNPKSDVFKWARWLLFDYQYR